MEVSIIPVIVAVPGFNSKYKIIYKNKGNSIFSGNLNLSFPNDKVNFLSAIPNYTSTSTNSITWNFTDLQPFESDEIEVQFNVFTPPTTNAGDILNFEANISPSQTDETPNDNTFELNQTVVSSFDPNDKTCLEGNTITPEMVGNYLHYLIRFENTGTANATNIVVKDIIDTTKLDISTLQITDASHLVKTKISEGNKVEFVFENINLPFTEPDKHGYISFKIKTSPSLIVGDQIENNANIYFDYNLPVETNTAQTSVQNSLGTEDIDNSQSVFIYPNPVKDIISIKSEKEIIKAEIYDLSGRILQRSFPTNNQVNVSQLKSGNYIIVIYSDNNKFTHKFIKL